MTNVTGSGLEIVQPTRKVVLRDKVFVYTGAPGEHHGVSIAARVENVFIERCTFINFGIILTGAGTKSNVYLSDCRIENSGYHGIYAASCPNLHIHGCSVMWATLPEFDEHRHGMYINYNSPNAEVEDCYVTNAPGEAIKMRGGGGLRKCRMFNNRIAAYFGGGDPGQMVLGGVQVDCTDNSIEECTDPRGWGIVNANVCRGTYERNTVRGLHGQQLFVASQHQSWHCQEGPRVWSDNRWQGEGSFQEQVDDPRSVIREG